jgi:ABC-type thiamine transport system ATPase subunit
MHKSAVYSWRLPAELKSALEDEARRSGESLAELLERLTLEWLEAKQRASLKEDAVQERLRAAAARTFGTISGGNPSRSEQARKLVRERLRSKHAR